MRNIVRVLCALAFSAALAPSAHAQSTEIQSIPKTQTSTPKRVVPHAARVGRKVGTTSLKGEKAPVAPAKTGKMAAKGAAKKPGIRKGRQAKVGAKSRAKTASRPRDSSGRFMKRASSGKAVTSKRKGSAVALRNLHKGLRKGHKVQHHGKLARR